MTDTNQYDIKEMIYTVRNKHVMLDSDLAKLYQVETKSLNRSVKRNISRFPENFCFQLTNEEYDCLRCQNGTSNSTLFLRSQIATSNENDNTAKKGGRRYLPYVFTEQGVAMLSAVLRSDIAVHLNIYQTMKRPIKKYFLKGKYMMHSAYL